jgi:hypothetical protein
MYLGDNFIVGGITALVDDFRSCRPDAHIMLTTVPDPRQFGVAELDEAVEVVSLVEKVRAILDVPRSTDGTLLSRLPSAVGRPPRSRRPPHRAVQASRAP